MQYIHSFSFEISEAFSSTLSSVIILNYVFLRLNHDRNGSYTRIPQFYSKFCEPSEWK